MCSEIDLDSDTDALGGYLHLPSQIAKWHGRTVSRYFPSTEAHAWINPLSLLTKELSFSLCKTFLSSLLTNIWHSIFNPTKLHFNPPRIGIGGINGMNSTLADADSHTAYINSFVPDLQVDWTYNRTHGPIADLGEVPINYLGYSPNTANALLEQWTAFHNENKNTPGAKYLQFCHSQGAIHVKNALMKAPRAIQQRLIVVAIAPGAVVPKKLCFNSFNYASKKDFVPLGELAFHGALDSNECGISKPMEMAFEHYQELILLEPHEDATGIDHDFQSPTFREKIDKHIKEHVSLLGVYE